MHKLQKKVCIDGLKLFSHQLFGPLAPSFSCEVILQKKQGERRRICVGVPKRSPYPHIIPKNMKYGPHMKIIIIINRLSSHSRIQTEVD